MLVRVITMAEGVGNPTGSLHRGGETAVVMLNIMFQSNIDYDDVGDDDDLIIILHSRNHAYHHSSKL